MDSTDLIAYIGRVHGRTYEAAERITDGLVDWRPREGEFTMGELVTHIANARLMNLGALQGAGIHYKGHATKPGTTRADLLRLLLRTSKKTIANLTDIDLEAPVESLTAASLPGWNRVLGGLAEHEIHHRSQLCDYLSAAGIEPPPLYGLHAEDLPR
jgi:uncharacterized damage-inducible protein DinB